MKNKSCTIILGPTAVGKTNAAIEYALHQSTSIISADSRQCYKELAIGVAKPSTEQLTRVDHYFINSHSIYDNVNAQVFEKYALDKVHTIFLDHDTVVMVGGTGLYIKAFCEGFDEVPSINSDIRNEIISNFKNQGINWLVHEIKEHDPEYFIQGEIKNPQRMMRALEVKKATGRSITSFRSGKTKTRDFRILKIGLQLPRAELNQQIDNRVDQMIKQGLVMEAETLYPQKHLNALQTVGYRELFDFFEGLISLDEAIAKIKVNTRRYAKRQMTWFKKDPGITWIDPYSLKHSSLL